MIMSPSQDPQFNHISKVFAIEGNMYKFQILGHDILGRHYSVYHSV